MQILSSKLAAKDLGLTPKQMRGLIEKDIGVVRRGRPGKGGGAQIDVEAVRLYLANGGEQRDAPEPSNTQLVELADRIPEIAARAMRDAFDLVPDRHKAVVAPELLRQWYATVAALRRDLGADVPRKFPKSVIDFFSTWAD